MGVSKIEFNADEYINWRDIRPLVPIELLRQGIDHQFAKCAVSARDILPAIGYA
jgi:hypothetical protein